MRTMKDPTAEMQELHERRMKLALQRHEAEAAMTAASQVVEGSPERRRQVLIAEARGDDPGVTVEQVDRERQLAEHMAADQRQRAEALRTVEREIGEASEAVIDAHPQFYIAAGVAASEAASEAMSAARDATAAAAAAWRDARAAWSTVRMSGRRRRVENPAPEMPVSDLGSAEHELAEAIPRPWPTGNREKCEQWAARSEVGRSS